MTQVDDAKLNDLLMKVVGDMGAAFSASLVTLGEKLGLYKKLAEAPATSAELAERTGTNERYVREWLNNQAAGGYVEYDAEQERQVVRLVPPHTTLSRRRNSFTREDFSDRLRVVRRDRQV